MTPEATANRTGPASPGPTEAFLRDRSRVRVRPVVPSDRPAVVDFLCHLSRESLELRFFSAVTAEVVAAEILNGKGWPERLSLVLETIGEPVPRIVGHGEFVRSSRDPSHAEVAFLVADDHQGRGAGTLLLRQLARHARRAGVRTFDAVVMTENGAMLDMFTGAGFPSTTAWSGEEATVELDISHEVSTALVPVERPAATALAVE